MLTDSKVSCLVSKCVFSKSENNAKGNRGGEGAFEMQK